MGYCEVLLKCDFSTVQERCLSACLCFCFMLVFLWLHDSKLQVFIFLHFFSPFIKNKFLVCTLDVLHHQRRSVELRPSPHPLLRRHQTTLWHKEGRSTKWSHDIVTQSRCRFEASPDCNQWRHSWSWWFHRACDWLYQHWETLWPVQRRHRGLQWNDVRI